MSKLKINKGFITQKIDDKTTIFSGEESKLYTLNDTAALIFQGLKLGWDEEKIAQKLNQKYGISTKEAMADIKNFKNELLGKNILVEGEQ